MTANQKLSERIRQSIRNFVDAYDMESWPGFLMFMVVVTLGMGMNWLVMRKIVGDFLAILVSGLFEAGIVAWKVQSWRKKNNEPQQEVVNWATWISVFLALIMLVVNLFRAAGDTSNLQLAGNSIIGAAALLHVVAYLIFDQNDDEKELKRTIKADDFKGRQREHRSTHLINALEDDMRIIRKISVELRRINEENADLPVEMREPILETTRKKLLAMYKASENVDNATKDMADLNGDNRIGPAKPTPIITPKPLHSSQPLRNVPLTPHPALPVAEPVEDKAIVPSYTMDQLLRGMQASRESAQQMAQNIGNAEKAFNILKSQDRLPTDMTIENFTGLFNQLNPT